MKPKQEAPKEMVGGCCVCSDENGWTENPLVYCDGQGCNVAVHQACYGIVSVPTGSWFCRKCESQERASRVRCELCPNRDGAFKRSDSGGWAHVVCALYIPEIRFGNVTTMEPIMLQHIPPERFTKSCYICDGKSIDNRATMGACMQCNKSGCKQAFHVTCAQSLGLLCEEAGNYQDNVKYCGYCQLHHSKLRRGSNVKTIPPYRPQPQELVSSDEDKHTSENRTIINKRLHKLDSDLNSKSSAFDDLKNSTLGSSSGSSSSSLSSNSSGSGNSASVSSSLNISDKLSKSDSVSVASQQGSAVPFSSLFKQPVSSVHSTTGISSSVSSSGPVASLSITSSSANPSVVLTPLPSTGSTYSSHPSSSSSSFQSGVTQSGLTTSSSKPHLSTSSPSSKSNLPTSSSHPQSSSSSSSKTFEKIPTSTSEVKSSSPVPSSTGTKSVVPVSALSGDKSKATGKESSPFGDSMMDKKKVRRSGSRSTQNGKEDADNRRDRNPSGGDISLESALVICEEKNLGFDSMDSDTHEKEKNGGKSQEEPKLMVQYTPNVTTSRDVRDGSSGGDPIRRGRSVSTERGRRTKRSSSTTSPSMTTMTVTTATKRSRGPSQDTPTAPSKEKDDSEDSDTGTPPSKRSRLKKNSESTLSASSLPETVLEASKDISSMANGLPTTLLLGNQINPASDMAQKMTDTLHAELEAHSIYKEEETKSVLSLIGPTLPGKKESTSPNLTLTGQPPPLPLSLEQLLERQWEQGSQFLMEQAQHFDIASLLSCLHQLRQENVRLEETVGSLVARRDHLLAVNARLSVPLTSNQTPPPSSNHPPSQTNNVNPRTAVQVHLSPTSAGQHSGLAGGVGPPPSGGSTLTITPSNVPSSNSHVPGHSVPLGSATITSRQHPSQVRHPSGGGSGSHPQSHTTITPVGVRSGSSPLDRRAPVSIPLENGLGEPEYRYRSPSSGSDHTRQQSPMMPPSTQPSPTSMRQSPASSNYHSSSHSPALSPSASSSHPQSHPQSHISSHPQSHPQAHPQSHGQPHPQHPPPPPHSMGGHGQPPPPPPPQRGYPAVFQMVSPPVGSSVPDNRPSHHSPGGVSMGGGQQQQQVLRREADSNRGSSEKR